MMMSTAAVLPAATVILVGDSDIARWPSSAWPTGTVAVSGRDGATLQDTAARLQSSLHQNTSTRTPATATCIVVLCAGENDVGAGTPVNEMESTMQDIVSVIQRQPCCRAVVLGPKLEPWLVRDTKSRRDYARLAKMMERCCDGYDVVFLDCLTLFCDHANVPGAVWGNKATPNATYFDTDQLHLSQKGYGVWKRVVDEKIAEMQEEPW